MERHRPRSLFEYLELLNRRKLFTFILAAILLAATWWVIRDLPDMFESSALIVVASEQSELTAGEAAQVAQVSYQLNSRNQMEQLVRCYPLFPDLGRTDDAVDELSRALKIVVRNRDYYPAGPESIRVSFRHRDPKLASQVVRDLVGIFERSNESRRRQVVEQAAAVAGLVEEVRTAMRMAEAKRQSAAAGGHPAAWNSGYTSAAAPFDPSASLGDMSDRIYGLERQAAEQRRRISEQESILRTVESGHAARSDSARGVLLARRADLEAQLKVYASQYTSRNPKVIQTQAQAAEINAQIRQIEAERAADSPDANLPEARELRAMQQELVRLEIDLQIAQRQQERAAKRTEALQSASANPSSLLGAAGAASAPIDPEYESLKDRYKLLMERGDELHRIQTAADAALFRIIDPPNTPKFPVAPQRFKLLLLGLVFSIVAAIAVGLAVEIPSLFRIEDARDIDHFLAAPVLAHVPDTPTHSELARGRKLKLAFGAVCLAAAVLVVPALALLLERLRIFELLSARFWQP